MAIIERLGGTGAGRALLGGVLALIATGCERLVSWDDRWMFDTGGSDAPSAPSTPTYPACEAGDIFGYHYPNAGEFWLGSQAALDVSVSGPGFLVAGAAGAPAEELRFARSGQLFVAPDGTLSLASGEPALGYPPDVALGGSCLVELRAPLSSPPRATRHIALRMNFEPRPSQAWFDILDPAGTSSASTSFIVFDSIGAPHVVELYFTSMPGYIEYNVVVDGADLAGGTPGWPVLVSTGTLLFTTDGALDNATTPMLDISFIGLATANQAIDIDFGPDITNDGSSGYAGSTMFATSTAVLSQSVDGHTAGTGADVHVGAAGDVQVRFDNGDALTIGTLALARFPREAALAPIGDDGWVATSDSGAPQLGAPQQSGRGALVVTGPGSR
jgi:flagellar hook protein FlgE